jgi:hypothetical protein
MTATQPGARRLWALDVDKDGRPAAAHLVLDPVPTSGDRRDSMEAVCGHFYSWNDHIGWWVTTGEQLPLALTKVHCGHDIVAPGAGAGDHDSSGAHVHPGARR